MNFSKLIFLLAFTSFGFTVNSSTNSFKSLNGKITNKSTSLKIINTMKSFSKIFIIIALFSAIGFTANAQPGHRPPPDPNKKAEEQTNHMKKTLQLNELQINKVEAINLNYANEIHKIHEANKAEREAMRKAHEDIDSKRNEELKAVLTETQYISHLEMEAKHRRERKGPPRRQE